MMFLYACSTKKNTVVHRAFHNLNARFNGYFNSTESIKEGVVKIRTANKDNFDELIPIYVTPNNEDAKKTFPEFDKAIKKASLMIHRHTIKDKKGNEIPKAGKWIDNCWINIGIAHYYKREFFSGIEALDYVTKVYKTKDKYTAMYWLVRSYNEIGAVSESEVVLDNLINDKKVPEKLKKSIFALNADYYIKRGNYKEAIKNLDKAIKQQYFFNREKNIEKARCAFVAAQLYEEQGNFKKAREHYTKVIKLKPSYEMSFYAKMKLSVLFDEKQPRELEKQKYALRQMTKETKNNEYLDVIYYTLGLIEEKQKHPEEAVKNYNLSVRKSTVNAKQKAYSYLKLADIYFDQSLYVPSGLCYDSAITSLPKTHKQYQKIVARKEVLQNLIKYIQTVHDLDSIQKLSKFPEDERLRVIDRAIKQYNLEKEKKQKEKENNAMVPPSPNNTSDPTTNPFASQTTTFYFYNATAVSYGVTDFIKRWGNRNAEDDWRRSQKAAGSDNNPQQNENTVNNNNTNNNNNNNPKNNNPTDPKTTRDYYLKTLLLNDSSYTAATNKIIESYYLMGLTYKEDLDNKPKSINAFEELCSKYPNNHYQLSCYYQLYQLYQGVGNSAKSNEYKDKILTNYPNSEFAQLIKNPNYIANQQNEMSETDKKYTRLYEAYKAGNYGECALLSKELIQSGISDKLLQKVDFFRCVCDGKTKSIDTMEMNLKKYIATYPKTDLKDRVNEILIAIANQKKQLKDSTQKKKETSYIFDIKAEHSILIITVDDPKMIAAINARIDAFNKKYYSNEHYSITSLLFGTGQQCVLIKTQPNAEKAMQYLNNLKSENDLYEHPLRKEIFEFYIISDDNLKTLFLEKNLNAYKAFYEEKYKTVSGS